VFKIESVRPGRCNKLLLKPGVKKLGRYNTVELSFKRNNIISMAIAVSL